jgi:hypothetical protein
MQSEHPDPELAGYRPVNGWALAALLLGFAGPLAFADPLLWWVPLVGIAIAIVALARIRRSDLPTVGRKAAIVGLILSLAVAAAAPTRLLTRNYWLVARADELANQWFERLRAGQTRQAYDLMFHSSPRHVPPPHIGSAAPPEASEKSGLENFLEKPPVPKLLALGDGARAKRVQAGISPEEMGRQNVSLWYQVEPPGEQSPQPYVVQFLTQRRLDPDGKERWLIQTVWGNP